MIIKTENLFKSYRTNTVFKKKKEVLKNINIEIKKNSSTAIIGKSGSGKSTLLKVITLMTDIDKGKIYYMNKDITNYNNKEKKDLKKDIQIIFQDPLKSLSPKKKILFTLREPNIVHKLYSKEEEKKKIFELLELLELEKNILSRYPHQLSGGQIQRIAICRALLLNSKLIILDEPLSMLDVIVRYNILKLLKRIKKEYGITYIIVSHQLDVVEYFCDEVLVIEDGIITQKDTFKNYMLNPKTQYSKEMIDVHERIKR